MALEQPFDLDRILAENPGVDADQFRATREALAQLRKEGVTQAGYGIESPYHRRPLAKGGAVESHIRKH